MNFGQLRLSLIVFILAVVISSHYCLGKDNTANKDNSMATNKDNGEVSERRDDVVTPGQDSNSVNGENSDGGERKEDGEGKEEKEKEEEKKEVEKKEGEKEENKEEDKKEEGEKKEEEEKKEEDKKEEGGKEGEKEEGAKKDAENGIENFVENSVIESGITDNKDDSGEGQESIESQQSEEKKENGDAEQQGSIHTSIMEGLYKLDYKLKFLRRMLRKDKKMIIQIHALGYLVDTIKEQIVRDVTALNSIVKMEAENASELNKLQAVHDNHVSNKLDFIRHENIVQVNN
ncbi:retinitis pigmentosa GTPase regulator [Cryptosporidium sp. chipmunk genotype I]|uniref:retinitis pigmentosa GTPase regulator n=1 Tax=Cryptosporidium sp. chipmunk genotype I TaxID=1280935 RepID=UPI00351A2483|nr:retinitis pigmentosa GTPase regulator [Cryptosporidium sp. chipmunk genotype I]